MVGVQNDAGAFSKCVNLVRAFKSVRFDVKKKKRIGSVKPDSNWP